MRRIAIFNIAYGSLGLLSTLLLVTVMPMNPLPPSVLASGAAASAYVLASGVILLVWGDRLMKTVRRLATTMVHRVLDTRPGRMAVSRTKPLRAVIARIVAGIPRRRPAVATRASTPEEAS